MPSEVVAAADFRDVWPPGFRFHPTDEELVLYYLKRKIRRRKLKLDVIGEVDVYKFDPEELPGLSMLKSGDRQWFFFSPRDRKYPNGSRSNRATRHGYWKATGKDRTITCNSRAVGIKKTLVFYKGRAPSGERTDWVMHEYVLEENELKSCQDAQDYYVLYKVFKKSGAGPKNGEQYGALFREEDWADDVVTELTELGNHNDQNNHVKQPNAVTSQVQCTWNDIEEFLKQTVDEPALVGPDINEFEFAAVPQVFGEGAQSTMTETSFGNAGDTDLCKMPSPFSQQNVEGTLDLAFSASSQLLLPDPYEVASAGLINLEQHVFEEDFLEMNDLLDQEISCDIGGEVIPQPADGELTATSQWVGADGLSEFDLYYDADVLIRETGTIEQTTYAHSYPNLQASQMVNLDDLEWRQPSSAVNNVGSQQGTYDQTLHFPTLNEPIPLGMPLSTSGDECGGNFSSYATGSNSNQIQNGKGVEGEDSWYTSALWSFVDSIPTTPASAAESALVNRAFERMSSFTRLRMNLKSTTASTAAEAAPRRSSGGRMKGFFLLSFMGALLAILFVLIGTFGRIMRPRDHVE